MLAKVTVEEAAEAVSGAPGTKLELVGPFVQAAVKVLAQETGEQPQKGQIHRVRSPHASGRINAMIAVTGDVGGLAIYSMEIPTACGLAAKMIGDVVTEFDDMAQSAIAEMANMVTGQAGIALERAKFNTDMSPPALLIGEDSTIATFDLTRLVIPLVFSFGTINVDLALKAMKE